MRAVICTDYVGIDGLRAGELPDPTPGPGQALISVKAASINFPDVLMVEGKYQMRPEPPFSPGFEVAGDIIEVNGLDGYAPGDRVIAYTGHGGLAERLVASRTEMVPLPPGVDYAIGAALPIVYGTAYHALVDRAALGAGETLLVLGGAGGVGLAAVQIGKALGARVVAAVSSEEKARVAADNGADATIRYELISLRDAVKEISPGGIDVVFDPVGGAVTETALRSLGWGGRLLVIGFASGDIPSIPTNLTLLKGVSVIGVFWGRFTQEDPSAAAANFAKLFEWLSEDRIRPLVDAGFDLDSAVDALRLVANRQAIGKLVVIP